MSKNDDHRWDSSDGDKGYGPECDEAYEQKFDEWQARDWLDWLAKRLTFPFTVTREEIVGMEQWDEEFLDLMSPAQISFSRDGLGELHFGAVDVSLDWRAEATGSRVDFSFTKSRQSLTLKARCEAS